MVKKSFMRDDHGNQKKSWDLSMAFAYADGLPTSELEITGRSEDQGDLSVYNEEQLKHLLSKYKGLHESMGPKMKDGGQKFIEMVEKIESEQEERKLKPKKTGKSPCAPPFAFGEELRNYREVSQNVDMQDEQRKRPDFTISKIERAGALHGFQKSACNARTSFNQRRENPAVRPMGCIDIRMKEDANISLQQCLNQSVSVPNVKGLAKRRRGTTLDTAMELSDDEEKWSDNASSCLLAVSSQHAYGLWSTAMGKEDFSITYPRGDPEAVEVRQSDMKHLNDFEFLNDTVIDFYIKYIQEKQLVTDEKRNVFYFFNTFFYKKLLLEKDKGSRYFCELQKWTRRTNIFEKKYLLFPIHDSSHWSLCIVCFGSENEDKEVLRPFMLHLDSLREGHRSDNIFSHLHCYLQDQWKNSRRIVHVNFNQVISKRVEVPLQQNAWDCGLFLLFFIQCFVRDAPIEFSRDSLKAMFGKQWFKPEEASNLRSSMKKLLEDFFKKAKDHSLEIFNEDID